MPRRIVIALVVLLLAASAHAHPEGFSGFRFLIWQDKAKVLLTLHTRDLGQWFPPREDRPYSADVCQRILESPADIVEIHFDDVAVTPSEKRATSPETGMIAVELTYPISKMPAAVTMWSKHLVRLPRGHQQLLFVEDMRDNPNAPSGHTLLESTLSSEEDNATVEIPRPLGASSTQPTTTPAKPPARISFFMLGVEHIVTGYDHLLFLAALLLVSRSFKEAAGVVTFFTVAHSITLTLAALDVVRMPARIVEPAIAASILYVGVENIVGKHKFLGRALITFAFGLVHGLGFASALREVGLGSTSLGIAMPLLKFSLGLESGQLSIAAAALAVLLTLRRDEQFERRWVPACSLVVAMIGGYWLVTRILSGA